MTNTNIKQEEVKLSRANKISKIGVLRLISVGLFHGGKYFSKLVTTDMRTKEKLLCRQQLLIELF